MDELSLIVQSLIDSEVDDMILDLVYDIHSSIKGIPQEQFQLTDYANKKPSIEKQTCLCPNCGQTNLVATRFSYHLAKCLGAGRQSSRRAKCRIVDQIMIITSTDKTGFTANNCDKDTENHCISEDGSSCTDSTSSSMTLISSGKIQQALSNGEHECIDSYDNDEEDDWKPKQKKRLVKPNKRKKNKDVLVVVSPSASKVNISSAVMPMNKFCSLSSRVVIPLVPVPISSIRTADDERIIFQNHQISSHPSESTPYYIESPLNLVEDERSSIIIFKEDIIN